MNHQISDSKEKKPGLTQTTPPGESGFEVTDVVLRNAETNLENSTRKLNRNIGKQNYYLRWGLGAAAAIAPLLILIFVGTVIWHDPEKIKSIGNFAGSTFVAAPLLAFLTVYGLSIQSIFHNREETTTKIHPDANTPQNPMNSEADSDEHKISLKIEFEHFVRNRADDAGIAKDYAYTGIPYITRLMGTDVYGINSATKLNALLKDLLNHQKMRDQSILANRKTVMALEEFIQFRQNERNNRKQSELDRKIRYQKNGDQNYMLRWIFGILGTVTPFVIVSFLGAVVWCKPDTFAKMGSYAGAAFVSTALLAFVVVYGFLMREIFNGRKQDNKYTVAELWDLVKRNTSIALND